MAETKINLSRRVVGRLPIAYNFAESTTGTDAYEISLADYEEITAYEVGREYVFLADVPNTGPATLEIDGLGAVPIRKYTTDQLVSNDIVAGSIVRVTYDGTYMQLTSKPGSGDELNHFGDGSDGNVTISSNTTLTRDMYYANLTVNTGITLTPNGFKIFVRDELILNGTIAANGTNGNAGGQGGTSASGGSPGNGGALGTGERNGGQGVAGDSSSSPTLVQNGVNATNSLGTKNGVAGGASSGSGLGGYTPVGGTAGVTTNTVNPRSLNQAFTLFTPSGYVTKGASSGGGAGGGGHGDDVGTRSYGGGGGGGGSGYVGGLIVIYARTITISATGSITANGGNGGAGGKGGTCRGDSNDFSGIGGGGGGGGSGGVILLVYRVLSNSGTVTATGGTGGTGGVGGDRTNGAGGIGSAGSNGTNGNAGDIYYLEI